MKSKSVLLMGLVGLFFGLGSNAQGFDNGFDNGYGSVMVQREIQCSSNGFTSVHCTTGLDRTMNIYLARQLSHSPCIEGQSYAINRDRILVRNGCRAIFVARGMTSFPLGNDQILGTQVTRTLMCSSQGYSPTNCYIPLRRIERIFVGQQYSSSPCVEGQTYFIYGHNLQVTNGCRASFVVVGME